MGLEVASKFAAYATSSITKCSNTVIQLHLGETSHGNREIQRYNEVFVQSARGSCFAASTCPPWTKSPQNIALRRLLSKPFCAENELWILLPDKAFFPNILWKENFAVEADFEYIHT